MFSQEMENDTRHSTGGQKQIINANVALCLLGCLKSKYFKSHQ